MEGWCSDLLEETLLDGKKAWQDCQELREKSGVPGLMI